MNRTAIMRLLCLLLTLVLCFGLMAPITPAQASQNESATASVDAQESSDEDASESSVALPESIDEFYMDVAMITHKTTNTGSPDRAIRIFPVEINFPIVGYKLVFEYDRTLAQLSFGHSNFEKGFPNYSADSTREYGICVGTVTASSDTPIASLEGGISTLEFGISSYAYEHKPFDVNITEFIVYVPLADGTVAEYTPDHPAQIHVPLMQYGDYETHLGPRQTALSQDWIGWGSMVQEGPMIWRLQKDGTLVFSGVADISDYKADALAPWMEYRDQIKKVVMHNGIHTVGSYAFYGCPNLEEVIFPTSHSPKETPRLFFINESAFDGCASLKKLSAFPVTNSIGDLCIQSRAFAGTALTTFHVPDRASVERDILEDNYSLTSFTVDPKHTNFSVDQWGALIVRGYNQSTPLHIFPKGMQGEYHLPYDQSQLPEETFANCQGLTKIVLSQRISVGSGAFRNCSVKEVYFPSNIGGIAPDAFENVTATIYYDPNGPYFTEDKIQHYGGNLTWVPHTHEYTSQRIEPTCTEKGTVSYTCSTCGYYYEDTLWMLDHDMGDWIITKPATCTTSGIEISYCSRCDYSQGQATPATGHAWQDTDQEGMHTCTSCGLTEGKYRLYLPGNLPSDISSVWVDGVEYSVPAGDMHYLALTHTHGRSLSAFQYENSDSEDVHTQYPSFMYTWLIYYSEESGNYGVTHVPAIFQNTLLSYAGTSIRIKGVKGIRMITGVHSSTRKMLIEEGIREDYTDYKLKEYGTLLAWAKDLEGGNPLTLGQPYVKSNYAYKRDVADPIYRKDDNYVYYTNVLVGFTMDQCKDDIAMRPYLILENEKGEQVTIYGGIIYRSIGYIAYQNRNVFKPSDPAYDYVWDIIHHVYADQYDAEFKG